LVWWIWSPLQLGTRCWISALEQALKIAEDFARMVWNHHFIVVEHMSLVLIIHYYTYIYNIHIQMTQPAQLGILQNTKFIEPTTYERHTIRYIYIHRYACFPMFGGWHIACNGGEVFIGATKKGTKPGSVVSLKRCARNTANCWLLVPDISRYCLYIHAYSIPTPELSLNDICALWEGLKAPMIGFCWQICKKHRNRNTKDGGL
jgi:hypothetical protein